MTVLIHKMALDDTKLHYSHIQIICMLLILIAKAVKDFWELDDLGILFLENLICCSCELITSLKNNYLASQLWQNKMFCTTQRGTIQFDIYIPMAYINHDKSHMELSQQ